MNLCYNLLSVKLTQIKYSFNNPVLWSVFIAYIIVSAATIFHHELWGDEVHSWNIAKASNSFTDLISNTRYEGHPPVWYSILWIVSKFTHDVMMIQWVQLLIAIAISFLILFVSPFPLVTRSLVPFGYFFLYEYGVFSRNYAIGLLCAFSLCIILHKNFKYKLLAYYFFLFLLANTHLLALALAVGFHIYFLLNFIGKNKTPVILHVAIGLMVLIPPAYFIFPPSDSSLNADFWLQRWDTARIPAMVKAPVRAFLPIPAWWNYHFWNTNFLTEAQTEFSFLKWIIGLLSMAILFFTIVIFRRDKKVLFFYMAILLIFFLLSLIIPFANSRQVGFVFIGFLAACWLFCYNNIITRNQNKILTALLMIQIIAGAFSAAKEIEHPFSNGVRVKELIRKVPEGGKWVTDYWCVNTISAHMDTTAYCIDLQKEKSFLQWDQEIKRMLNSRYRYYEGMNALFEKENLKNIFMITMQSPQNITRIDSLFLTNYNVTLFDEYTGAIEKGSNLYLYEVTKK